MNSKDNHYLDEFGKCSFCSEKAVFYLSVHGFFHNWRGQVCEQHRLAWIRRELEI